MIQRQRYFPLKLAAVLTALQAVVVAVYPLPTILDNVGVLMMTAIISLAAGVVLSFGLDGKEGSA